MRDHHDQLWPIKERERPGCRRSRTTTNRKKVKENKDKKKKKIQRRQRDYFYMMASDLGKHGNAQQ